MQVEEKKMQKEMKERGKVSKGGKEEKEGRKEVTIMLRLCYYI